ncbi:MAG: 4-hydroxy-tetrahydrodipicolinate synthase, partial [Halarsenatibacteraceae bacterium]
MTELRGTFAVLATPFDEDEEINYSGLEHNINWNIERGVHGIIPLGSTGEFTTLSKEESNDLLNFVIKEVDGRVPIIAGTSADSTSAVIEKSKYAEAAGVDGLLILPPYYFNPLQEEMVNHYSLINDEVNIPVMVYNNPGVTNVDIQLETVLKISEYENVNYIKESTGDLIRLRDIENNKTNEMTTFCGCDELALESFFAGAQGWVSVISNAFPGLSAELFEVAVEQKDYNKAREIYDKLLPFCKELEGSGKLVQVIKYLMDRRGAVGGCSKQPKLPLTKEDKYKLDKMLEK